MRIAFIDIVGWDYRVESVYEKPLGGSQSALCYLAEALAQQGHDIFLLNCTTISGRYRGVTCQPWRESILQLRTLALEAFVVWNTAALGIEIKPFLSENTSLILWAGIAYYQQIMEALQNPTQRDVYDGIAFVSEWQQQGFYQNLAINLDRTCILRNAPGYSFCGIFADSISILAQKFQPPILAYTTVPDRGLNILLEVFPKIRIAVPGTRLKVFSSLKVYQANEIEDNSIYGLLYQQCRQTEGIEYIGSISQPDLARELRSVMVLAYPCTVAETSCITVMEAMASGCRIVTSNLAALPETTAGFATLIPIQDDWEVYKNQFTEAVIQSLQNSMSADTENHLRQQVDYINNYCTWSVRAEEWVKWLSSINVKPTEIRSQAYQYLIQGEYSQAATLYEQAIEDSETISNYWYLGLTYLLQGEQAQAQATWMFPLMNCESEELEEWTADLIQVLSTELQRWESLENRQNADLIRQQILEIIADSATED
ncbi:glycosyltransferase [Kamptonema sp. UHCC 0994]|uniref:glycosyltransferase n=1 Tax=Kamptonema sp. UHCC 0994 TaxID=3031329 RepID=UPI0023B9E08E|nr:glycosyltransferase [Kamptonema sp. UHCC 0994]MDF0554319.1 glycosyltransferase [Kamptonema sp. UHCC 0994]